jgi:putative aldouronate transport system permease protein
MVGRMKMKEIKSKGERIEDIILHIIMIFVAVITLYPILFVFSSSISDPVSVMKEEVWLFPKGFSLRSYKEIFATSSVWRSYYNTLWYTIVGTSINVFMTVIAAYPLSRKTFFARNHLMFFISFTMFFSGGLIPAFILVNRLGLYNTRWAMILPGAVSAWNIIVARTFYQGIPDSLEESAKLDGANDFEILLKIMIPLSAPIVAVLTLFYAVGHWNAFFNALLYLPNPKLQPLQIYLMKILVQLSSELADAAAGVDAASSLPPMQLRYALIIVTVLPILCIYPFVQKYFVKGIMIGAIKG